MVHPVQSVIESLYAAGRCPRLHVNALFEGVSCPDFIREQWRERLIIDLDPSYPLDLTFEADGLGADLSFGGYVTRCSFPYGAVYVVADRSTGRGIVLDQNMPDSVKRTRYGRAGGEGRSSAPSKPALRPVAPEPDPETEGGVDDSPTRPDVPLEAGATDGSAPSQSQSQGQAPGQSGGQAPDQSSGGPAAKSAEAASGGEGGGGPDSKPESKADTEQVQKRRAAFRVIDGGS